MSRSRIDRLTAADIMNRDVVYVGETDTLQDAMSLMVENHVTGLPVLDAKDRCVGLISATDILTYEQDNAEEAAQANADVARYFDPVKQRGESLRVSAFALETFAELPVRDLMSRDLIARGPDTPVREVARQMVAADVHRLLVLDEDQRLLGLISAFDFVALAARE